MNTSVGLVLQGGHSACFPGLFFLGVFSPILHFKQMCLKNIILKVQCSPVFIIRKKGLWTVDSEQTVLEMGFCKRKSIF